jgi:hypothetical protein
MMTLDDLKTRRDFLRSRTARAALVFTWDQEQYTQEQISIAELCYRDDQNELLELEEKLLELEDGA